jgi:hypothetical protein
MNKVKLKAKRRPTTSDAVPQKLAPMQRPRKSARVVYRIWFSSTPNSLDMEVKVSAMPYANMFSKSTQSLDVRTHLKPQVISHPAATAKEEKLPLVPAHAHVGNGAVDDFRLACFGKLSYILYLKTD